MPLTVKLIRHRGESRIGLFFEKNADLIARVKKVEGSKWSQSLKVWHIPDTAANRTRFKVVVNEPSAEGYLQLEQFQRYLRSKRYSESTVKTYSEALKSFLTFYKEKSVYEITNDDVIIYNNSFILKNHLSSSYQNQIVNALKLYFTTQRGFKINIDQIHRPKREKTLPNVLSKEEVKKILEAHLNLKHKTMLSL